MREKEEREGVERWKRKGGYVHRLDQSATSFFFTNFPVETKAVDLWPKFAHFGRVGEVYIPNKLDKQGRRFGFVKYRDVKDVRRQLDLISNIWVDSFKLRVNIPRFEKGSPRQELPKKMTERMEAVKEANNGIDTVSGVGKSYKTVLAQTNQLGKTPEVHEGSDRGGGGVVWEVEVEAGVVAKLSGAFVGFLNEDMDHQAIQQNFILTVIRMLG
jgi:RNA recognition motif-containing protein